MKTLVDQAVNEVKPLSRSNEHHRFHHQYTHCYDNFENGAEEVDNYETGLYRQDDTESESGSDSDERKIPHLLSPNSDDEDENDAQTQELSNSWASSSLWPHMQLSNFSVNSDTVVEEGSDHNNESNYITKLTFLDKDIITSPDVSCSVSGLATTDQSVASNASHSKLHNPARKSTSNLIPLHSIALISSMSSNAEVSSISSMSSHQRQGTEDAPELAIPPPLLPSIRTFRTNISPAVSYCEEFEPTDDEGGEEEDDCIEEEEEDANSVYMKKLRQYGERYKSAEEEDALPFMMMMDLSEDQSTTFCKAESAELVTRKMIPAGPLLDFGGSNNSDCSWWNAPRRHYFKSMPSEDEEEEVEQDETSRSSKKPVKALPFYHTHQQRRDCKDSEDEVPSCHTSLHQKPKESYKNKFHRIAMGFILPNALFKRKSRRDSISSTCTLPALDEEHQSSPSSPSCRINSSDLYADRSAPRISSQSSALKSKRNYKMNNTHRRSVSFPADLIQSDDSNRSRRIFSPSPVTPTKRYPEQYQHHANDRTASKCNDPALFPLVETTWSRKRRGHRRGWKSDIAGLEVRSYNDFEHHIQKMGRFNVTGGDVVYENPPVQRLAKGVKQSRRNSTASRRRKSKRRDKGFLGGRLDVNGVQLDERERGLASSDGRNSRTEFRSDQGSVKNLDSGGNEASYLHLMKDHEDHCDDDYEYGKDYFEELERSHPYLTRDERLSMYSRSKCGAIIQHSNSNDSGNSTANLTEDLAVINVENKIDNRRDYFRQGDEPDLESIEGDDQNEVSQHSKIPKMHIGCRIH